MIIFTIKIVREEKHISLLELHEKTGFARSYLYKLENNLIHNTNIYALYRIANELDVNVKEILYSTEDIFWLKKRMYKCIERYGFNHQETLKYSHIIDLLNNEIMSKK